MASGTEALVFLGSSEVGIRQFYLLEEMEIKGLLKLGWNIQVP